jgi:hypothetical protein
MHEMEAHLDTALNERTYSSWAGFLRPLGCLNLRHSEMVADDTESGVDLRVRNEIHF